MKKYIVQSCLTDISVISESGLMIIDLVKTSHPAEILCLDVAEISKDIVSFSSLIIPEKGEESKHLIVHGLEDNQSLRTIDSKATQEHGNRVKNTSFQFAGEQQLKWKEYWRCDPKLLILSSFLNTVNLSPQGDALFLGGNEFISLWSRDSVMSTRSFTLHLYYAKKLPKQLFAQCLETREIGQVLQAAFTADSRAIVTLEQDNQTKAKTVRVWYNQKVINLEEKPAKQFVSRKIFMNDDFENELTFNQSKVDLDYLSFVQIKTNPKFDISNIYSLPFSQTLFANEEILPIAFCLVCAKSGKVQLWVESLIHDSGVDPFQNEEEFEEQPFQFYQAHTFTCKVRRGDDLSVCLISLESQVNSVTYKEVKVNAASRLLDPSNQDYISLEKAQQEQKLFQNMMTASLNGNTSQDFLAVLTGTNLGVFSVQGLRNYPQMHIEVEQVLKVDSWPKPLDQCRLSGIVEASTDSMLRGSHSVSDSLKLICLTQAGEMVQVRCEGTDPIKEISIESQQSLHLYEQRYTSLSNIEHNPSLPISAICSNDRNILFYSRIASPASVRTLNAQFLSQTLKFMGRFTSKKRVKSLKWIPGMAQLVVLFEDNAIGVLSASFLDFVLEELTIQDYFQDFKSLWTGKLNSGALEQISFRPIIDDIFKSQERARPMIDSLLTITQRLDVLSFEVFNCSFITCDDIDKSEFEENKNQELAYSFGIMLILARSIEIHEVKVMGLDNLSSQNPMYTCYKLAELKLDSICVKEVLCVLNQSQSKAGRCQQINRAFLNQENVLKCCLRVHNEKSSFLDLLFLQLTYQPSSESKAEVKILWQSELPSQDKRPSRQKDKDPELDYQLLARMNDKLLAVFARNVGRKEFTVFLYDHSEQKKYLGYIELLPFMEFYPLNPAVVLKTKFPIDIVLPQHQENLLLFSCLNRLYVLGWNGSQWNRLKVLHNLSSFDVRNMTDLKMNVSPEGAIQLILNNCWMTQTCQYLQPQGRDQLSLISQASDDLENDEDAPGNKAKDAEDIPPDEDHKIQTLNQLNFTLNESEPLYSVRILKDLFINGKKDFIMKIFVQLDNALKSSIRDKELIQGTTSFVAGVNSLNIFNDLKISNIANFQLAQLLEEINKIVENQVVQQSQIGEPEVSKEVKKAKNNDFDDFFGGDSDEDDVDLMDLDSFSAPPKKEQKKVEQIVAQPVDIQAEKSPEQQFNEIYDTLLENLVNNSHSMEQGLVEFLLVFKNIYSKDFFSDDMASTLLRELYLETEQADKEILEKVKQRQKKEESGTKLIKKKMGHEIYAEIYDETNEDFAPNQYQKSGNCNIDLLQTWNSKKTALALYTVNQDVIIDELNDRFDFENNANWETVKKLCVPVWVKDSYKLRLIVDWIGKVAFREITEKLKNALPGDTSSQSKAEAASLWCILQNKKQYLIKLYEQEKGTGGADKIATLLGQDFSNPKWKTTATKNAMVLRQKQRYLLCTTFFILANDIKSAIQIMKFNMKDPMLAILTCRMMMLQQPTNAELPVYLYEIYEEYFIQRGNSYRDTFLTSIGLWGKLDYISAVNSLQTTQIENHQEDLQYLFEKRPIFKIDQGEEKQVKKTEDDQADILPLVTQNCGFELMNMVTKLQKAPRVTEALKGGNAAAGGGYGADEADIFAAFDAPQKKDEKKDQKEIVELKIDRSLILTQLLGNLASKRDIFLGLFLIRENRELLSVSSNNQNSHLKQIMLQILLDQVMQTRHIESYLFQSDGSLTIQIEALIKFLFSKEKQTQGQSEKTDIFKIQFRNEVTFDVLNILEKIQGCPLEDEKVTNTMLIHEIDLRMNAQPNKPDPQEGIAIPSDFIGANSIAKRLEFSSLSLLEFLKSCCSQPNLTNFESDFKFQHLQTYRKILVDIETMVECLILFEHYEENEDQVGIAHSKIIDFFDKDLQPEVASSKKEEKAAPKPGGFDMFDDMMGGDDDSGADLMDFDFEAPRRSIMNVKDKKSPSKNDAAAQAMRLTTAQVTNNKLVSMFLKTESHIRLLLFKTKCQLLLYLTLCMLGCLLKKFTVINSVLQKENLLSVLKADTGKFLHFVKFKDDIGNQLYQLMKDGKVDIRNSMSKNMLDLMNDIKQASNNFQFQSIKTTTQKFRFYVEETIIEITPTLEEQREISEDSGEEINDKKEDSSKNSLFSEAWQTELHICMEEAKLYLLDQNLSNKNQSKVSVGLLVNLGFLNPETLVFVGKYLQLISMKKTTILLQESIDSEEGLNLNHINQLLKDCCSLPISKLKFQMVQNKYTNNIDNYRLLADVQKIQEAVLEPSLDSQVLYMHFKTMSKQLDEECSIMFSQKLTIPNRQFLAKLMDPDKSSQDQLYSLLMRFFFQSKEKMAMFFGSVKKESDSKFFFKAMNDQFLNLIGKKNSAENDEREERDGHRLTVPSDFTPVFLASLVNAQKQKKQPQAQADQDTPSDCATAQVVRDLFWTGIELFKQKSEQISDFAFDNTCYSENIALGLMTSGCREIPMVNTLLFRNRIENGLQCIDEENLTWDECLHRYDELEKLMFGDISAQEMAEQRHDIIKTKDEPIKTTLDSMFLHKTLLNRGNQMSQQGAVYMDHMVEPCETWNGQPVKSYTSQLSKLDITHEDYTYAIDSHPHLPIYITGNRRGILCSWKFNQKSDKSLSQFMPEVDPRVADAKKACVKKLQFNGYGDKIISQNFEGSLAIYQLESASRQMRKVPIFSLYEGVDSRIVDFDLVNSDNVILTLSQKHKCVKLYDTLMPFQIGKLSAALEVKLKESNSAGNLVLFNRKKQMVYVFNGRQGSMVELDLRMNLLQVNQFQLSKGEEITAVCLNQVQDTLVTGYKDGVVKIHSLETYYEKHQGSIKNLKLRETIDAFPLSGGKKGIVQKLKINKKNNGLFASSSSGILKMLRPSI